MAASLANEAGTTGGTISLFGSSTAEATLDVGRPRASAPRKRCMAGRPLGGDALVEFASGEITTIAANGALRLFGADAFVADASDTTSNSALTGLATVEEPSFFTTARRRRR